MRDISLWPCLAFLPGFSLAKFTNIFSLLCTYFFNRLVLGWVIPPLGCLSRQGDFTQPRTNLFLTLCTTVPTWFASVCSFFAEFNFESVDSWIVVVESVDFMDSNMAIVRYPILTACCLILIARNTRNEPTQRTDWEWYSALNLSNDHNTLLPSKENSL